MTEPSEWEVASGRPGSEPAAPAIPRASWSAFAGHLLVLFAAALDAAPPSTLIVAAVACSVIAMAGLITLGPSDARARRSVTALICGHGVAAATLLAGIAPSVPRSIALAGLAAAAALGPASLVLVRPASRGNRPARPLPWAPRVAAILLMLQALAQRWAASASGLSMPLRAASFFAIAVLGIPLLASLSLVALPLRPRWALAGLLAWTVGWVALTVDLDSLALVSLGHAPPLATHPLDAELVQLIATAGGLGIGAALVTAIHHVRFRHSTIALLAGYAAFGVIAAITQHRMELATDFPRIAALRDDRDMAAAIMAFALAGVLWLYWRGVAAPRASSAP